MTSAMKRSQKTSEKKSNHEHALIKLFKAEVGDNVDIIIRPTCSNCEIHTLIDELK